VNLLNDQFLIVSPFFVICGLSVLAVLVNRVAMANRPIKAIHTFNLLSSEIKSRRIELSIENSVFKLGSESVRGQVDIDHFDSSDLTAAKSVRRAGVPRASKRLLDLVLAYSILIFLAPLLILTVIAIRLDSKGPILYRQTRVGLDGRPFRIFKFRSMRIDAEKDGAQWAKTNDDRVTRVGRFIRKVRIDEIPQALNIIANEMSFVGPRPERPEFVELLQQEIPNYQERHFVKPGLTGWAQVNFEYGDSIDDAREKLKYDLYYIKHFSVLLDIVIVLKTVRVALFGIGSR